MRVVACSALVRGEGGSLISPWDPSRAVTHSRATPLGPRRFWAVKLEIRAVAEKPCRRPNVPAPPPAKQACFCRPLHAPQAVFCFLPSHPPLPSVFPPSSTSLDNSLDRRLPHPESSQLARHPSTPHVLCCSPVLSAPQDPFPDLYHSRKLDSKYIQAVFSPPART